MSDLDALRNDYEQAEAKAQKLMADKDDAIAKVLDRYGDKLRATNDEAAAKQKVLLDAEAAAELQRRIDEFEPNPDSTPEEQELQRQSHIRGVQGLASSLGLTLPTE